MSQNLENDTNISHAILNFLNASYRGKFAEQNALSQLGERKITQESLVRTEKTLETINRWLKDLWKGMPLFSASWASPETFESKRALDLLGETKTELQQMISKLKTINANADRFDDDESIRTLIGAFLRFAYSKDNFIKGFVEYGKVFSRPDIIEEYSAFLPGCAEDIASANLFVKEFKQKATLGNNFFLNLSTKTNLLHYILQMNINDINHLRAVYEGTYTYQMADISRPAGEEWSQIGMDPKTAGYWSACEFKPAETIDWLNNGFLDSMLAARWRYLGFTAQNAAQWQAENVYPELAAKWLAADYTLATALGFIKNGVVDPDYAQKK